MENENTQEVTKKGSKWIGLLVVVLIIAAILVGGYFYLTSKASASSIFKSVINDTISKTENLEECENLKSEVKISGKLETEKSEYKQFADMLVNSELVLNTQISFKERTEKVDLKINQDNKELLAGNVYYAEGDDNLYIFVNGVLDKYFKVGLNQMDKDGEVKETLNRMFDSSASKKLDTVKKILNDEINNKLKEDYFTQEKVDGLKKSTLKLTVEELKTIVKEIAEDLQKNEEFLACYDNSSEIKESLSELVDSLKNIEEKYNKDSMEISIYTKGLFTQEFVKGEITLSENEEKVAFFVNKVDNQNYEFNLKVTSSENNMIANIETLSGTLKIEKLADNIENVTLSVGVPEFGKVTLNVSSKLEKNVELEKADVTNSIDYNNMTQDTAREMLDNISKLPSYNLVKLLLSNYLN